MSVSLVLNQHAELIARLGKSFQLSAAAVTRLMSTSNDFRLDDGVGDEMGDSPGRLCQPTGRECYRHGSNAKKQVGVQLPTSADNVALLAVAAARSAAVADRRPTGRAAIDRYIFWPPGSAAANAQ